MAATLDIVVKISGDGTAEIKKISNAANEAENSTKKLSESFFNLSNVLKGVAIGALGKETIDLADTYKMLQARLTLVSGSINELATAQSKLFAMSQETRSRLEATTTLYSKLELATASMGKSQKDVLAVTDAVSKALKVSGASAAESSSAMLQLGQALASGALRGDELNLIMENAPRLAKAIADGMGVTIGELRKLGAEGKLTAEQVFNAIEKSGTKLNEEFKKIPPTVSDSMTQIKNSLEVAIGSIDSATGSTQTLANGLTNLSKYISDNKDDWAAYGQFVWATLDRTIDMFKLVGAFAKNTVEYALGQMSSLFWGFASIIADANLKATSALHSIGLSSDTTYKTAQSWATSAQKNFDLSRSSVKSDIQDMSDAINNASATVEDRIKIMNANVKKATVTAKDSEKITAIKTGPSKTELAEAKKRAEEYAKAIQALNDEGLKFALENIQKEEDAKKAAFEADLASHEAQVKYIENQRNATIEYYKAIGDIAETFSLEEADRMQKLADTGAYTNEQMIAIWTKDNEKFQKEQREKDNKFWLDLFSDFEKAMDNQIFDAMTGKWNDFGDWLKDFWSSMTTSIARAASSQLSNALIGGIQNFFIGSPTQSSGLATNVFRLVGSGLGVGSTLSASEQSSIMGASGSIFDALSGNTTTAGGTVINAEGQITSAGSDIMSLASNISSLKTAYNLFSGGIANIGASIEAAIAPTIETIGSFLQASQFNIAGTTVGLGAGALGGVGGYAVGSLGDALFGADTKASTIGSIGGAIGAAFGGPVGFAIGAGLGSIIGGLFGSTKTTDTGISFGETTGAGVGFDAVQSYESKKKKSWFSSKSWTEYTDLSSSDLKKIMGIFDTYDYLLAQLGSLDHITLAAGKYSKDTFQDQLSKNFISTFTGIPEKITSTISVTAWESVPTGITAALKGGLAWTVHQVTKDITSYAANPEFDALYQSWTDYADSVDKTVMEALSESVNTFISSQRTFDVWSLERSGNTTESLRKQAEWLQQDFENLASMMGVTGVTVDNFSQMYSDAVKNSFDPTTISQWDSLSSALMSATDAQDKYLNSIGQTTTAAAAAAAALQAASNALNNNLKVEQLVSSTQQMFAPNDTESAKFAAQSARTQYEMLKSFYGLNVSDSEFLATMQSSLTGAGRTDTNVSMWSDLTNAFQSAYNAEKQYSSILSDAEAAKLEEQQRLADASVAAAKEIASAAEEAAKKLTELKIQSRDYLRSFNEYLYKDDALNLAAYQVQYLTSDLSALEKQLGISGVTLSNFQSVYDDIVKNFTEDNVNAAMNLGNTLMKVTDAQKAYNDALKETVNTGFMKDMMLSKVSTSNTAIDIKEMVSQQSANNANQSQQIAILYEVVKTLKDQLKIMKFGTNQGVPA